MLPSVSGGSGSLPIIYKYFMQMVTNHGCCSLETSKDIHGRFGECDVTIGPRDHQRSD